MKKFTILFVVMISCWLSSFGTDYTFCYGSIAVTLNEGGRAKQMRYGTNGAILKTVTGEWTAYGYPTDMPGQTIKIKYSESSEEFSYVLVRDGAGNPSVLIDGQGRRYTLCKTSVSKNQTSKSSGFLDNISDDDIKAINKLAASRKTAPLLKYIGFWQSTDDDYLLEIKEIQYQLTENESMGYASNEKKISLQLTMNYKGSEIFNGISTERGVTTYSGIQYLFFVQGDTEFKINLPSDNRDAELSKYKKKYRDDQSYYFAYDVSFSKVLTKTDAKQIADKIAREKSELILKEEKLKLKEEERVVKELEYKRNKEIKKVEAERKEEIKMSEAKKYPLADIDGNNYGTVEIGSQVWMAENLNSTKFRNGELIPQITDPEQWKTTKTGAWCYYENKTPNGSFYGKLYNWYAVNDSRGLAPEGWHIPTNLDIDTLILGIGSDNKDRQEMRPPVYLQYQLIPNIIMHTANVRMKAVRQPYVKFELHELDMANSSGFSGLLGGWRDNDSGSYYDINNAGFWWISSDKPYCMKLSDDISVNPKNDLAGLSVRCVKNVVAKK